MKKILLTMVALLTMTAMYSQEKVASYYSSAFAQEYEVLAEENDGVIKVYLGVSGNYTNDRVYIYMANETKLSQFITALEAAKKKYLEWKAVAEKNGVTNYTKEMDIKFPNLMITWVGASQWYVDTNNKLKPEFFVGEDGAMTFIIRGTAYSINNQYITQQYYFTLAEESEFDKLIEEIKVEKIKGHFSKKTNVDAMFK